MYPTIMSYNMIPDKIMRVYHCSAVFVLAATNNYFIHQVYEMSNNYRKNAVTSSVENNVTS